MNYMQGVYLHTFSRQGSTKIVVEVERVFDGNHLVIPEFLNAPSAKGYPMPKDMTETRDIFERRESAARSYCRSMPAVFTSASGSELTADTGKTYIDFLAGCSSLNYGHNDPDMNEALIAHISSDGIAHGLDLHTDAKADFLEAVERHAALVLDLHVTTTGSE